MEHATLQLSHVSAPPVARNSGSYHYSGCGCGERLWQGDMVDWVWADTTSRVAQARKLRIGYLIPHHNVTGGMKMIVCVGPRAAGTGRGPRRFGHGDRSLWKRAD